MSYEQAVRHSRNHRKDRFVQQCNGYFGDGVPGECYVSAEEFSENSKKSLEEILKSAKEFPIFLYQDSHLGIWKIVPGNHLFGQEVSSRKDLERFAKDFAES